jgi:transcriptional regulator with XRE-family HTH domain
MNPIEQLNHALALMAPSLSLQIMPPFHADGVWSLDISSSFNPGVVVEWSERTGFGVSTVRGDTYGEGPDEVYPTVEAVTGRLLDLLRGGRVTAPQVAVSLGRLRERRDLTQVELARRLGISQASLSGMERRNEVQVSSVRKNVEAMGGWLEVYGCFPDAKFLLDGSSARSVRNVRNEATAAGYRSLAVQASREAPVLHLTTGVNKAEVASNTRGAIASLGGKRAATQRYSTQPERRHANNVI